MKKKKKEDEDDDRETSLFNPGGIDAKNAPKIERTFPTVMEKKRGRIVSVSGFSSECEDVLHEARARARKFDDTSNNKNNELEKKRAFVLRESVLGAEEEKEKERIQFPLTTIGEDFSIGQSNAKKEGKAMKVRGQRNECLENTNSQAQITTTMSMMKWHTKVMPPRLRREIDLASVARHPVRAKRRGREEDKDKEDAKKTKKKMSEKSKSNVILHVKVYDNWQFVRYPKLNCEVLVHGDTRLTQLKDEIECLADYRQAAVNHGLVNDLRKKSDDDNGTEKKEKEEEKARSSKHIGYKEANEANESGFFFIENVFYDDLRSKNSVSLSKGIVDASKKYFIRCPGMKLDDSDEDEGGEEENGKGKENGASIKGKKKKKEKIKPSNFTSRDMRETTFSDLEIIPGKSYLYRHQGSCDHILRFRDVRVANMDLETAKLSREHYPIVISEARKMRKPCMCCEIHDATTTAYGDNMAVCSPFFWCDSCFNAAHPTEEEKKGTETYPYFFE